MDKLQVSERKQVLFEEDRSVDMGEDTYTSSEYYQYTKGDLAGIYAEYGNMSNGFKMI